MKKLKISIKKIIKLYKSGLSATQIGEQMEISHQTAWRRLKKAGIKLKNGGYYSSGQFKKGNIPWSKGIDNRITKICKICGKKFMIYPYRKEKAKFCSKKCLGINKKGHIPWNKGKTGLYKHSKETRKTLSKRSKKMWANKKIRKKILSKASRYWLGKKRSTEDKEKMRKAAIKRCKNKDYLKKMSEETKMRWQNKEYREKTTKAIIKGMIKRPTSLEKEMINLIKKHNLPYKYTGDGRFLIGYKNPDFVNINGEKKLIEVGNVYHHQGNYIEERSKHFAKYGWKSYIFINNKLNEKEILKELRPETWKSYS